MLCLRKVSVRNMSRTQLHASHCAEVARHPLSQQTWLRSGQCERGACGQRDLFLCVLHSPVPSISWRRADGNPLPGKIKINHSSGVLEIPYFRPEDAGVYECVAENSRGRNVARGQLLFHSKNHVHLCFLFHGVGSRHVPTYQYYLISSTLLNNYEHFFHNLIFLKQGSFLHEITL